MRKWILQWINMSLVAGLLFTGTARSQSWFNANVTGATWQGNARATALGHVGTAEAFGVMNLFTNPALLSDGAGLRLEGSSNSMHRIESRSFPAIDQFGDVVTNNIYNITESWQTLYKAGGVWSSNHFALGVGTAPYWSPFFRYSEDVRGNLSSSNYNRDPLVGSFQWDRSGEITETALGMSTILPTLNFGFSVGFLSANDLNVTKGTIVITPDDALDTDTTNVKTMSYDFKSAKMPIVRFGLSLDISNRLKLAIGYESGTKLVFENILEIPATTESLLPGFFISDQPRTIKYQMPDEITVGVNFQPTNVLRTIAYFEGEWKNWSRSAIFYSDYFGHLLDTWTYRGGVEHSLFNGLPVRAGFIYAGSPLIKSMAQTWITLGSGYTHGNLVVDVAMEYGMVDYSYPDLFVAAGQTHHGEETVHESTTKFALTLAYVFKR